MKRSVWRLVFIALAFVSCGKGAEIEPWAETGVPTPLETVERLGTLNKEAAAVPLTDFADYPAEIQKILRRGSIIFGMTAADQKPFFYTDEKTGTLIGLDVEIGCEIANQLGVQAVFNRDAASFDGVVLNVVNKNVDVALSKLSRTPRRGALVRFTAPYITFRQALLINRLELAKVSSEENLPLYMKQFRGGLAIIKNSSYVGYAESNFPLALKKTYDTWPECIDALFAGEVLAAYRDEGEILIINETRKDSGIMMKPVFINDKQDPIAMAVSHDAPHLQEWLNTFLEDYILQHGSELTPARLIKRHYAPDGAK
ncbi:MAG: transporter substrate-binding domain-containing protein [Spirochaetaceae bacterium]|jgi:ABC-type amino acid transport substrate-binding protein|nr:transporter substrate-binding domain-containing protein [Spirochaetaceae bacterium]